MTCALRSAIDQQTVADDDPKVTKSINQRDFYNDHKRVSNDIALITANKNLKKSCP